MSRIKKKESNGENMTLELDKSTDLSPMEKQIADMHVGRINHKKTLKDKIESQQFVDSQIVRGKFMNLRAPGQPVKLTYAKYAEDEPKWTHFLHNHEYSIPRGFADQINNHYGKITDMPSVEVGVALSGERKKEQIYAFVSTTY